MKRVYSPILPLVTRYTPLRMAHQQLGISTLQCPSYEEYILLQLLVTPPPPGISKKVSARRNSGITASYPNCHFIINSVDQDRIITYIV